MDPFQIRMDFSSQLRRLQASQASIQKVLSFMSKHASRASDDLWDCIVIETSKASLNARLNILFLIDALVRGAPDDSSSSSGPSASGSQQDGGDGTGPGLSPVVLAAFLPLISRDLIALVDHIVPLTSDGVRLNLASTREVVSLWSSSANLTPAVLTHILARLDSKREQLKALPPAERAASESFSKNEILQRIEEDRERQKRLRERSWILPPKTYVNAIPHPVVASAATGASSTSTSSASTATTAATASAANDPSSASKKRPRGSIGGASASTAASSSSTPVGAGTSSTSAASSANNAALARDPLAALYGDSNPISSASTSTAGASTLGGRKSSSLGTGSGSPLTPAKRKANGSLISSTSSTSASGRSSSHPILLDGSSSQQTRPQAAPVAASRDALQIEMGDMWETTSDLNEDDFEGFAEEDGAGGVALAVANAAAANAAAAVATARAAAAEANGHGPKDRSEGAGAPHIVAAPPPIIPRWWGSRAIYIQRFRQRENSIAKQQHQQKAAASPAQGSLDALGPRIGSLPPTSAYAQQRGSSISQQQPQQLSSASRDPRPSAAQPSQQPRRDYGPNSTSFMGPPAMSARSHR
ncbi:hypothetical protein OC846_000817 [Tilletia horrida]|uniref:CID domain-containing protein n=1 Tax=Tilletia horrida TaxID=155126 RepID=A0AAN6JTK9_9BASI|nr:hypothetical protein OC845_002341 [Tilletia horrida]KAK0556973.1 hypothetical protein OC846_000817 [Tilletia horrida]KAK0566667.1 hypothetical protein OC861_003107 [Tilletia horrida]